MRFVVRHCLLVCLPSVYLTSSPMMKSPRPSPSIFAYWKGSNTEDLGMSLSNSYLFVYTFEVGLCVTFIVHLRSRSVTFIVRLRFRSVTSASTELLEEAASERCTGAERTTPEKCKFLSRLTEGMDAEKLKLCCSLVPRPCAHSLLAVQNSRNSERIISYCK